MCGRCQLGGARAFQQYRVGEPLNPLDVHPGGGRHLLDGCAGADAGLNFLGTQHAGDLNVDMGLTQPGSVAARCPPQPVVDSDLELVAGLPVVFRALQMMCLPSTSSPTIVSSRMVSPRRLLADQHNRPVRSGL